MDKAFEKVFYAVFYVIGIAIRGVVIGLLYLIGYGIWKYKEAHPPTIGLSEALRFEHTLITCGSGWGKTQLLQQQILAELPEVRTGARSVIVVDSQGDMIKKILRLAELAPPRAPPPPPPEVSAVPAQKTAPEQSSEPVAHDAPARSSVPAHIWQIVLVFLLQCILLAIITVIALLAKKNDWSTQSVGLVAITTIPVVGFIICGWLGNRKKRPAFIDVIVGAALFSALVMAIVPERLDVLVVCLIISGTIVIGFLLVRGWIAFLRWSEKTSAARMPVAAEYEQYSKNLTRATLSDRLILIDPIWRPSGF